MMKFKIALGAKLLSLILGLLLLSDCQNEIDDLGITEESEYEQIKDSILNSWDSIIVELRDEIIENLNGKWAIDTIEVEFQNSYANSQLGIKSDTILVEFGEIEFGKWHLLSTGYPDSSSFENVAELTYEDMKFKIDFDYLLYTPELSEVYSYVNRVIEENHNWDTERGRLIDDLGILDNIQIVSLSPTEFYLMGLNRGIRKLKLRKL